MVQGTWYRAGSGRRKMHSRVGVNSGLLAKLRAKSPRQVFFRHTILYTPTRTHRLSPSSCPRPPPSEQWRLATTPPTSLCGAITGARLSSCARAPRTVPTRGMARWGRTTPSQEYLHEHTATTVPRGSLSISQRIGPSRSLTPERSSVTTAGVGSASTGARRSWWRSGTHARVSW